MRDYILTQAASVNNSHVFPGLRQLAANWSKRRRLHRLEDLDDRMLDDIGVTRDEVTTALRLPLSLDPIWELNRQSLARRSAGQRGR
jgi:uncharacterized protein YjiS (DUF1127 family)